MYSTTLNCFAGSHGPRGSVQGDKALSVQQADTLVVSIAMAEGSSDQGGQVQAVAIAVGTGIPGRQLRLSLSTVRAKVEHGGHH